MSSRSPRSRSLRALLPVAILLTFLPGSALAQVRKGDFPSWERDTETTLRPLPVARQGQFTLALSVELADTPIGVDVLTGGDMAVALVNGDVAFFDPGGEPLASHGLGEASLFAPTSVGRMVAVALPSELVLVSPEGVAWRHPVTSPIAMRPKLTGPTSLAVTLKDGTLKLLDLPERALSWEASTGSSLSCGPAIGAGILAWGTSDGQVLGFDEGTGEQLWTVPVGDRVDALTADRGAVYVAAHGRTARTRDSLGPFAGRIPLKSGGRQASPVRWRLRLGAACKVAPLLLDGLVAYPSQDGYIHAVSRKKGGDGWRTDMPSRVHHPPTRQAGRLDFALPYTGLLVSVSAETGGIKGWASLEDEDETFVGPSVGSRGLTVIATNFGRLVGFRFQDDPVKRD